MLFDSEIKSYKDELAELRKDAKRIKKQIQTAVNDGSQERVEEVKELKEKEKGLLKYIQDLVDELGGANGPGDSSDLSAENQRGSFGHTLLHSTIVDPEEEVAGGSPEDYSISDDPRSDRGRPSPSGTEQAELASLPHEEEEHEDREDLT